MVVNGGETVVDGGETVAEEVQSGQDVPFGGFHEPGKDPVPLMAAYLAIAANVAQAQAHLQQLRPSIGYATDGTETELRYFEGAMKNLDNAWRYLTALAGQTR